MRLSCSFFVSVGPAGGADEDGRGRLPVGMVGTIGTRLLLKALPSMMSTSVEGGASGSPSGLSAAEAAGVVGVVSGSLDAAVATESPPLALLPSVTSMAGSSPAANIQSAGGAVHERGGGVRVDGTRGCVLVLTCVVHFDQVGNQIVAHIVYEALVSGLKPRDGVVRLGLEVLVVLLVDFHSLVWHLRCKR